MKVRPGVDILLTLPRQWKNREGAPLFVLHDGPPYANGDLHMGWSRIALFCL
jgi:hypothetical protein